MLLSQIEKYWTGRAEGYSKINRREFVTGQDQIWFQEIQRHLPKDKDLKILDVGTGPGFFAILLAGQGYDVTAVDYTKAMLEQAKENAGALADRIHFYQMDAQNLGFLDDTFDVVISRNLTWNLESPDRAYAEWMRVLKEGGKLLNFDANWYHHLFDEEKRRKYEKDREQVEALQMEDRYTCTDIDAMEEIAKQVPMSRIMRPAWDLQVLKAYAGEQVQADEQVWRRVWDQAEQVNFASTPLFLITAVKRQAAKGVAARPA